MDNTNTQKDVAEAPAFAKADEKQTESTTATNATNATSIVKPQSTEPKAEAPAFAKAEDACTAKEGDTLLAIANRHKVSLGLLKVLNGIDDALKQLDEGKLIKLK